jgi:signal peptidase I
MGQRVDPLFELMFVAKYLEEGRALLKGARRVVNYERDRAKPEQIGQLEAKVSDLKAALKAKSEKKVDEAEKNLIPLLTRVQPTRTLRGIRDNLELIIVAIVLALGIRAFYLQPFKIPTGSMQPTLNGVIGHKMETAPPNMLIRAFQFVALGRTYEEVICQAARDQIVRVTPATINHFWDGSMIQMASGARYPVGISPSVLSRQMGLRVGQTFSQGEAIVRGYADLGDQLFVDKVTYNFVGAHRGDIFVFRTNEIDGIEPGPDGSSQHYIKRLGGLPGDTLRIDQPQLFVNGGPAVEFGFKRVESRAGDYTGYTNNLPGFMSMRYLGDRNATVNVPPHNYFALGDNSADSADSRYWGFVPQDNVVGRGLFVYWPFTNHWGFVK